MSNANVQSDEHRHRYQQHQEIGHHVQDTVRQIKIGQLYALPRQSGIPEFGNRMASEDEGKCYCDHITNDDEYNGEDDPAESAVRIDA